MRKALRKPFMLAFILCGIAAIAAIFYFTKAKNAFASKNEEEPTEAFNDIEARTAYEFNMLKNPVTGKIPEGVHEQELQQAKTILAKQQLMRTAVNTYTYQGPNNLGGRTRAIAYDVRYNGTSNQIILAGGISGGVFKSTDNGATWTRKSPTNNLYSVTSIAQDTRAGQQDTWYYTTGEATGNST